EWGNGAAAPLVGERDRGSRGQDGEGGVGAGPDGDAGGLASDERRAEGVAAEQLNFADADRGSNRIIGGVGEGHAVTGVASGVGEVELDHVLGEWVDGCGGGVITRNRQAGAERRGQPAGGDGGPGAPSVVRA